jgi:hypothetical protein
MSMAASLFALALLGADGPRPNGPGAVTYELRFVEMRGLGWRSEAHEKLCPVARQGGATVWTAPREFLAILDASGNPTVAAPKVVTAQGRPTRIRNGTRRAYVADLKRVADGPVGHATALAYQPDVGHVDEGVDIELCGRPIDQGMLTQVEIQETRLASLASYTLRESVQPRDASESSPIPLAASVQVPEIVRTSVAGEWLIPKDGLLIVGLGVHTSADASGKAVPCERLAVIEARPVPQPVATMPPSPDLFDDDLPPLPMPVPMAASALNTGAAVALTSATPAIATPGTPVECFVAPPARAVAALPTPQPPDRVLPTPINHRGEVVPLPPMPEEEPIVEESAEPRPAPQTRIRPQNPPQTEIPSPYEGPEDESSESKTDPITTLSSSDPIEDQDGTAMSLGSLTLGLGPHNITIRGRVRVTRTQGPATAAEPPSGCVAGKCCGGPGCDHARPQAADEPLDVVKTCPQAVATTPNALTLFQDALRAGLWVNPTFPPARSVQPRRVETAESVRSLSLNEAIRLALENSEVVRVVAEEADDRPDSLVVARIVHDINDFRFRDSLAEMVRSVEQQYRALAQVQAQLWACKSALEMGEEAVRQARDEISVGPGSRPEVAEAEERLERFRLDYVRRTADLITAERQLRELIGLPPADDRRIVATTAPKAVKVELDWKACLATMTEKNPDLCMYRATQLDAIGSCLAAFREAGAASDARACETAPACRTFAQQTEWGRQILHRSTHQLARFFLEAEAGYKTFEKARKLSDAARKRLEAARATFEKDERSIARYLDAINRWANAVALEAQTLTDYHNAITALEETRGTLLEREGIKVLDHTLRQLSQADQAKSDPAVARVGHEEKKPRGRIAFGLSMVPATFSARTGPFHIRMPVGRFGVIDVRSTDDTCSWLGLFW